MQYRNIDELRHDLSRAIWSPFSVYRKRAKLRPPYDVIYRSGSSEQLREISTPRPIREQETTGHEQQDFRAQLHRTDRTLSQQSAARYRKAAVSAIDFIDPYRSIIICGCGLK